MNQKPKTSGDYIKQFENQIMNHRRDYISPRNFKEQNSTNFYSKVPANSMINNSNIPSTGYLVNERNTSELRNYQGHSSSSIKPFKMMDDITKRQNIPKPTFDNIGQRPPRKPQSPHLTSMFNINRNEYAQASPERRNRVFRNLGETQGSLDIKKSLKTVNITHGELTRQTSFGRLGNEGKMMDSESPVSRKPEPIGYDSSLMLSPIRKVIANESKMEEVEVMRDTMEKILRNENVENLRSEDLSLRESRVSRGGTSFDKGRRKSRAQDLREDFYVVDKQMLETREILGHINPITMKFIPIMKSDGSRFMEPGELRELLKRKVLFVFIDDSNLEKMMIFSTVGKDSKRVKSLAANNMIIGQINLLTMRFIPDVYPGPGFFDWESAIKNKKGFYANIDQASGHILPVSDKKVYKLNKKLSKKIAILGHIDLISKKFVPKEKSNGEKVKYPSSKLKKISKIHCDPAYPEVPIIINQTALDYELQHKFKNHTMIQGRIDPHMKYFSAVTNQRSNKPSPSERILRKKAVIGYINPYTETFEYKGKEKLSKNELFEILITRKYILGHVDPKHPEIGYIILPGIEDEELWTKLSKRRGILGYIDVATMKFIPDIKPNHEDSKFLRKLIKRKAILGYLDPESLLFVKESLPSPKKGDFDHRLVGRSDTQKIMLGFMDPNLPSLAQVLVPNVGDFEVDSELMKRRTFLGTIDPKTQKFIPESLIEGVNGATFDQVLNRKLEIMEYTVKEPPLVFKESKDPTKFVLGYQPNMRMKQSLSQNRLALGESVYSGRQRSELTIKEHPAETEEDDRSSISASCPTNHEASFGSHNSGGEFKIKVKPLPQIQQPENLPKPRAYVPIPSPKRKGKEVMPVSSGRKSIVEDMPVFVDSRKNSPKGNSPLRAELRDSLEISKVTNAEGYEIRKRSKRNKIVKGKVDVFQVSPTSEQSSDHHCKKVKKIRYFNPHENSHISQVSAPIEQKTESKRVSQQQTSEKRINQEVIVGVNVARRVKEVNQTKATEKKKISFNESQELHNLSFEKPEKSSNSPQSKVAKNKMVLNRRSRSRLHPKNNLARNRKDKKNTKKVRDASKEVPTKKRPKKAYQKRTRKSHIRPKVTTKKTEAQKGITRSKSVGKVKPRSKTPKSISSRINKNKRSTRPNYSKSREMKKSSKSINRIKKNGRVVLYIDKKRIKPSRSVDNITPDQTIRSISDISNTHKTSQMEESKIHSTEQQNFNGVRSSKQLDMVEWTFNNISNLNGNDRVAQNLLTYVPITESGSSIPGPQRSEHGPILIKRKVFRKKTKGLGKDTFSKSVTMIPKIGINGARKSQNLKTKLKSSRGRLAKRNMKFGKKDHAEGLESSRSQRSVGKFKGKKVRSRIDTGLRRSKNTGK